MSAGSLAVFFSLSYFSRKFSFCKRSQKIRLNPEISAGVFAGSQARFDRRLPFVLKCFTVFRTYFPISSRRALLNSNNPVNSGSVLTTRLPASFATRPTAEPFWQPVKLLAIFDAWPTANLRALMTPETESAKTSPRLASSLTALTWPTLAIISLSLVSAIMANHFRSDPLPWNWRLGDISAGIIVIDNFDELDRLLSDPEVIIIDARDKRLYQLGHLPKAISIPADEASTLGPPFLAETPKDALILIYCEDPLCPLAEKLATFFKGLGKSKLHIFRPGFEAWDEAGRPTQAAP